MIYELIDCIEIELKKRQKKLIRSMIKFFKNIRKAKLKEGKT